MNVKDAAKELQNRAFTFYVKDYDSRNNIYTLENPITKETKIVSKEDFDRLRYEQKTMDSEPGHRTPAKNRNKQ